MQLLNTYVLTRHTFPFSKLELGGKSFLKAQNGLFNDIPPLKLGKNSGVGYPGYSNFFIREVTSAKLDQLPRIPLGCKNRGNTLWSLLRSFSFFSV